MKDANIKNRFHKSAGRNYPLLIIKLPFLIIKYNAGAFYLATQRRVQFF